MKFITIKESHVEADLLVLKSILESAGIECFLKNEYTNQVMTHMATFTVELQVLESDYVKAQEIMKQSE